jgi:peptidyl-prolyl cis-trans isomerase SurA
VAGTDFHPGVAAQVGDDTISVSHIDDVASGYCGAIEGQLQGQQQVLPMHYLRGGIVGELTLVEAARQFAAEKGVEAGSTYDQKVSQLQSAVSALPQDQQDAVIEVESSSAYIAGVEAAVGKQLLKAKGATGIQVSDATSAGQQAFSTWLDGQDIVIDPEFGVEIKNAEAVPVDTSLSYALGDTAKQASADSPDQTYAASLPSSHRCG